MFPFAARGTIAAMAMTGMRVVTTGVGLLPKPPPEEIFSEALPHLLKAIPPDYRDEAIEIAHWTYGAVGGTVFALIPAALRRQLWAGPIYGVATWAVFELGIAPLLGLRLPKHRTMGERIAIIADHLLYGFVVAGRPHGIDPARRNRLRATARYRRPGHRCQASATS